MTISSEFLDTFLKTDMTSATELLQQELRNHEINEPLSDRDLSLLNYFIWACNRSADITIEHKADKLKLLLAMGSDPNFSGNRFDPPLLEVCYDRDNLELMGILLGAGADPNGTDSLGRTAIFRIQAIKDDSEGSKRFPLIQLLINHGANINHKDQFGNAVLHCEIESKEPSLESIKLLIELGSDINFGENFGKSCLSLCITSEKYYLVQTLLDAGSNVNAKCSKGRTSLSYAAAQLTCPIHILELLIDGRAIVDEIDIEGKTSLIHASANGCIDKATYLVQHMANVNHVDIEGKSALHHCCIRGNAKLVKVLVDAGANIEQRDSEGRTPLMYAVRDEKTTMAMLAAKPDVNALDKQRFSALMHAMSGYSDKDQIAALKALLKRKAEVNQANINGDTALHLAVAKYNPLAAAGTLLNAGAEVNAVNSKGETPLMRCHGEESVSLLLKHGANVNSVDLLGNTALIHLITGYRCEVPVVKLLVDAGANLNIQRQDGATALMLASRSDDKHKTVKLLIAAGADLNLLDQQGQSATASADKENLKFLISCGAALNVFESSRLQAAVRDDDIPLATLLLERGVKMNVSLASFVRCKKTLEKLARSNADILRAGILIIDSETREQFDSLLAKFAKNEDVAEEGDLPAILKKSAWPIKQPKRAQLVLAATRLSEISRSIDYFHGTVDWPEGLKKSIIERFSYYSADKKAKKSTVTHATAQDYFKRLLLQKERIKFESFFENWSPESEQDFVKFWNENGATLDERVVTGRWRSLDSDHVAYLLARFDIAVLLGIIQAEKKSSKFAETLRYVDAPACAPLMALWMGSGPASRLARQWALKYPESCVKGLIVAAVSKVGKDRNAAEAVFRFIASRGHKQVVQSIAVQFGEDVLESISESLSQDFEADFMPSKLAAMPKFWSADVYPTPRLKANNKALPPYAVDAVASMMSMSNSEVRSPALDEVIMACDSKSLANFAWGAFEEWAAKGKKDSEWIFDALTYFGDDTCARKLTPYIRNWPRENGIARARKGLEILAAIGTDVALSQIQAISQKNKYQSILDSAQEMMKVIATARELTPQQLEDRLVPDLGLSERGEIKLDFGSRHFTGSVDAQLKPIVRDASGSVLKVLPSAGNDDDKNLAKEAAAEWAALCKDLKPIAKLQLERLELAMVNSRRWTGSDFKTLFVVSPMLQNLVKGLVWGIFSSKSKLSATFVVNAENAFVDADGKLVKVSDGSSIGIAHPLLLDEESLAAWQKLFAKNKQVQPFAQLVRKVYRAKDDIEGNRFGLNGATVASKALKGLLAMGWHTDIGDAGWIWSFERSFSSGRASLSADPGVHITDYEYNSKEQKLEVSIPDTLNPMEFSELIRELMTLKK